MFNITKRFSIDASLFNGNASKKGLGSEPNHSRGETPVDRAQVQNLLSDYVTGRLDASQSAEVARQVADDPELAQMEQFLRWLQPRLMEMKDGLPGDHATGEELVNEALGQGDFPSDREDWVREHLAECGECRELKNQIQEAGAQLRREDRKQNRPWIKIMMAAVVACVLIVSGVWIGSHDRGPGSRPEVASVHLQGLSRGEVGITTITPTDSDQLPPLVLGCDPWVGRATDQDFQLEIRLLARDERLVVKTWTIGAADSWSGDGGGILLDPGINPPDAGFYDLEVSDETGRIIFQTGFHLLPR